MANINTVRINGTAHSWPDIDFKFGADNFNQITSIGYDEKLTAPFLYGNGRNYGPIGQGAGKYEPGTLALTATIGGVCELRNWFAAKAVDGRSIGTVKIPSVVLQFSPPDLDTIKVEFQGVKWATNKGASKEAPDPQLQDIEFTFERLLCTYKGVTTTLYDSSSDSAP